MHIRPRTPQCHLANGLLTTGLVRRQYLVTEGRIIREYQTRQRKVDLSCIRDWTRVSLLGSWTERRCAVVSADAIRSRLSARRCTESQMQLNTMASMQSSLAGNEQRLEGITATNNVRRQDARTVCSLPAQRPC